MVVDPFPGECPHCEKTFPSRRALFPHLARVHGRRVYSRKYAQALGRCDQCGVSFHNRIRLIKHLEDGARGNWQSSCLAQYVLSGAEPINGDDLCESDLIDAAAARKARRTGRSVLFTHAAATISDRKKRVLFEGPLPADFVFRSCAGIV